MKDYIKSLLAASLPVQDIMTCYVQRFPSGPLLQPQDIKNMAPHGQGTDDVVKLLELLQKEQAQNDRWFIRRVS